MMHSRKIVSPTKKMVKMDAMFQILSECDKLSLSVHFIEG